MVNYRAGMTRDRRLHIPHSFSVVLINARLTFSPRREREKKCVNRAGTPLHTIGFFFFIEILILKGRWKDLRWIKNTDVCLLLVRIRTKKLNQKSKWIKQWTFENYATSCDFELRSANLICTVHNDNNDIKKLRFKYLFSKNNTINK